jgi:putative hemolysin
MEYCQAAGHVWDGIANTCTMPDGTVCNALAFYNAECGQAFSFCAHSGGRTMVRSTTKNGTATVEITCMINGKTCDERQFASTKRCP